MPPKGTKKELSEAQLKLRAKLNSLREARCDPSSAPVTVGTGNARNRRIILQADPYAMIDKMFTTEKAQEMKDLCKKIGLTPSELRATDPEALDKLSALSAHMDQFLSLFQQSPGSIVDIPVPLQEDIFETKSVAVSNSDSLCSIPENGTLFKRAPFKPFSLFE